MVLLSVGIACILVYSQAAQDLSSQILMTFACWFDGNMTRSHYPSNRYQEISLFPLGWRQWGPVAWYERKVVPVTQWLAPSECIWPETNIQRWMA